MPRSFSREKQVINATKKAMRMVSKADRELQKHLNQVYKENVKKEYMRERRRVQELVRSYKNKGYDVELKIPDIPKRITEASINRLSKITSKEVRKKSYAPDLSTGERINYNQYKIRYPKAQSPAKEYERIDKGTPMAYQLSLDYFRSTISEYPERTRAIMESKLDSAIAIYGEKQTGIAIQKLIDNGEVVSPKEAYNYRAVLEMSNNLIRYLDLKDDMNNIRSDILEELDSQEEYSGEFDEW